MEAQTSLPTESLNLLPPDVTARDFRFKIVLTGDARIGKTCILRQFSEKRVSLAYETTIGVEFRAKDIVIDDQIHRLAIWDLSGAPAFFSIRSAYLRGANGVMLCYDVTNRTSFESLKTLIQAIKEMAAPSNPGIILIGNKCDLETSRVVSTKEGQEFAKKHDFLFFETSALDSTNIELAFHSLAVKIYNQERKSQKEQ